MEEVLDTQDMEAIIRMVAIIRAKPLTFHLLHHLSRHLHNHQNSHPLQPLSRQT